jgi:hypothetical protein
MCVMYNYYACLKFMLKLNMSYLHITYSIKQTKNKSIDFCHRRGEGGLVSSAGDRRLFPSNDLISVVLLKIDRR